VAAPKNKLQKNWQANEYRDALSCTRCAEREKRMMTSANDAPVCSEARSQCSHQEFADSAPRGRPWGTISVQTQFAGGFGDWLIRHRVGLVCSTYLGETIYVLDSARGFLVRVDRKAGRREDVTFCPGFARGLAFVSHYAILTISLPRAAAFDGLAMAESMRARGATPWRGLLIVNLRNGDIVEWLRLEGDVAELFDVGVVPNVRCPRGPGPIRQSWAKP
jgi:hypothetical protein